MAKQSFHSGKQLSFINLPTVGNSFGYFAAC